MTDLETQAASGTGSKKAAGKAPLYPILAVTFVGTLGFGIVLPFLVFLVTRLGGNAFVYGLLGATYSAFQLVGAPILGRWSDRIGRRRVLLLSQLGTLASWAIFLVALYLPEARLWRVEEGALGAFTVTLPLLVLFFARALDGLTGGNVSVANAYLADITEEGERGANFGKMAVASNLGFILGPAIAGVLGALGSGEVPAVLAAITISVVASLMIAFGLPESRPCVLERHPDRAGLRRVLGQDQKDCFAVESGPSLGWRQVLSLPSIPLLMSLYFLVFLAFNFFYIAFPVHATTRLDWSLGRTGAFFTVLGLLMAVVQGPVLGRLSRRFSDRTLVVAGSAVLTASFACFSQPSLVAIGLGTVLLALGNGTMWPSLMALVSKATAPELQGAVQGFAGSCGAVASIGGLLVGGLLYELLGVGIFVLASVVVFAVVLASTGLRSPVEPATAG